MIHLSNPLTLPSSSRTLCPSSTEIPSQLPAHCMEGDKDRGEKVIARSKETGWFEVWRRYCQSKETVGKSNEAPMR